MTGVEIAFIVWAILGAFTMICVNIEEYIRTDELTVSLVDVLFFFGGIILGGVIFTIWIWDKIDLHWIMNTPFMKFKRKGK